MDIFIAVLGLLAIYSFAFLLGKGLSKIRLPAILGWLIAGMLLGPCLGGLVSQEAIDSTWYKSIIKLLEGLAGVMIGAEVIFKDLRKYGAKTIVITLFQSLGTFLTVSAAFLAAFSLAGKPLYLAFIFGGIALATAPAPVLSIVKQYRADGPVTKTLVPLSVIDDIIGIAVFFTVISLVAGSSGVPGMEAWKIVLSVLVPLLTGSLFGLLAGFLLNRVRHDGFAFALFLLFLLLPIGVNFLFDFLLFHSFLMNYILVGVFYSCFAVNWMGEERKKVLLKWFDPILSFSLLAVVVNLGMPLDYRYIAGSGVFTLVYILSRALGKIGFATLGGLATKSEKTVTKYLGLTLLPHSGVSLVFTGIAASTLAVVDPSSVSVVQGTIASAAVLNEIFAVLLAQLGLKKAGEIHVAEKAKEKGPSGPSSEDKGNA